ncbi:MAG: VanZ family protein [Lachnospiraceae bacterium]|nr:VanZ family protein [Lachnospiraceae bacterium]
MLIRALNDIWIALRSFDDQALTFASEAVLIYIFFVITKNIVKKLRRKKCDKLWQMMVSVGLFGILCVYLSYLMSITLSGREAGSRAVNVNLEIFGTWSADGSLSAFALENVLLFIPFGVLVPLMNRFFKKWWNLVLAAFVSSMLIELTQLLTGRGFFEIDDILLNTGGAIMGYIVFWLIYHSYIAFKHESQLPLSRHEQQINRITLFVIQLLPVILSIMLILGFGNDNADQSGELSKFVTEKLLYIVNKLLGFGWTAEKIQNLVPEYEIYVRKGAHFTEFGLLTFFTFVFLYCRRLRNSIAFIFSFILAAMIAVADEVNQGFVEGRNRSIKDVFIDCSGSVTMLLMILIVLALIRYYNAHNKIKQTVSIFK